MKSKQTGPVEPSGEEPGSVDDSVTELVDGSTSVVVVEVELEVEVEDAELEVEVEDAGGESPVVSDGRKWGRASRSCCREWNQSYHRWLSRFNSPVTAAYQ